jgi:DNA polymerase-3 subunit epsilon
VKLKLQRPLVFFDLESTGISALHDRIVQISVAKVAPEQPLEVKTRLINPEMPIPASATEVHGITDEMVKDQPPFRKIAKSFNDYLAGCDLAGFNIIQYDIPMLVEEFRRAGVAFNVRERKLLDAYQIFRKMEPRTLVAAVKFYCGEDHVEAHDSEADVLATMKVLEGQLHRYQTLPHGVDDLDRMFNPYRGKYVDWEGKLRWERGEVVLGFGKKIGTKLRTLVEQEPGFLEWMLGANFSDDVKQIVTEALAGRYPTPPEPAAAAPTEPATE